MAHTIQEQGNEGWTVNKKRRRGEEEDLEQTEPEETLQEFGINVGSVRTEAEKLAELHQKFPCVKVVRITQTGDATRTLYASEVESGRLTPSQH